MLTQKQQDYLDTTPDYRIAHVVPFNPASKKVAEDIIKEIESALPSLKVTYLGSSKLGIVGENDIDLNILAGDNYEKAIPVLTKLFGEPAKVKPEKKIIQWQFAKNGFPVEVHFTDALTPSLREQMETQSILENDEKLLKEYEQLKIQASGLPFKEYQKRKYEFWNRILGIK